MEKSESEIELVDRVLRAIVESEGRDVPDAEAVYALAEIDTPEGRSALRQAAAKVTKLFNPPTFDSCSIVNARSGRCPENCKWCAQSAHYSTSCETYDLVDEEECRRVARYNASCGIHRFSLVASGRAVKGRALEAMAAMLKKIAEEDGISTCASLGLLGREELEMLRNAGVRRYHCNLETAPSHFATLCTTHTIDDKLRTIAIARELGLEVCSGGIIGMGENRRQRAEFALKLREAEPVSIPINILSPIPGTPLESTPPISDDEILDTIALFRLAHPLTQLRFAGGRKRLPRQVQVEAMKIGINGGISGNLLTTTGATVAEDRDAASEAGYEW